MQEAQALPQVVNELRALLYLLGGGMTLLILKEVFSFIRAFKKSAADETNPTFQTSVKVEHALSLACLGRLETASTAQTAALTKATEALATVIRMLDK